MYNFGINGWIKLVGFFPLCLFALTNDTSLCEREDPQETEEMEDLPCTGKNDMQMDIFLRDRIWVLEAQILKEPVYPHGRTHV